MNLSLFRIVPSSLKTLVGKMWEAVMCLAQMVIIVIVVSANLLPKDAKLKFG